MSLVCDIVGVGLDAGSTTTKVVGVDDEGALVWHHIEPTEPLMAQQIARLLATAEEQAGAAVPVIGTGYGRNLVVGALRKVTEITCHARGVFARMGAGGSLIDIGGQDSKVISIGKSGNVLSFQMNDKCAAGTGRFLEVVAARLKLSLEQLAQTALETAREASISSTCTVFAESELISLLAEGEPLPAVVRGLHRSLCKRVAAMVRAAHAQPPFILSGGVAHSRAVRALLAEELGAEIKVPHYPQLMGAFGAALLAREAACTETA